MFYDKRGLREMLNSGQEFSTDQMRKFKTLWKETVARERMAIVGSTIDQITAFIVQEKKLDKQELRLSKLLSLSITLEEAMDLQLPNYYSYISHLIRSNGLNARSLLNEMTDFINRIEGELHKLFEEQVKVYRNMEDDDDIADTNDCVVQKRDEKEADKKEFKCEEETKTGQYESLLFNFCRKNKK